METTNNTPAEEILNFPELPKNLNIGKHVPNWGSDAVLKGVYYHFENLIKKIPQGAVKVYIHTHGLEIESGFEFYRIHNSQIISLEKTTESELIKMDKSVIGRAVVGGLILGPLGAIIGGISGIGTKEKISEKNYLIINFWDLETKAAQTLLIRSNVNPVLFINRQKKEKEHNLLTGRQAEAKSMPVWLIVCIIIILIGVLLFFL